jgi:xanthine dehydrogenase accessory factor
VTPAEAAPLILDALRGGLSAAEVVVLDGELAGARLVLVGDAVTGALGDDVLQQAAIAAARTALAEGHPRTVPLAGARGERYRAYVEPHMPAPELVIVGAGHIARPLAALGAVLGYRVIVLDDRPEFATADRFPDAERVIAADFHDPFAGIHITPRTAVVLVTRGHKHDYEALLRLLGGRVEPAYIGMVGSRRRVRAAFEQLVREGILEERLAAIHAPVGLDVGAETPEEIAVAIAAELVLARRGGTGVPLRDRDRVVERWIRGVD